MLVCVGVVQAVVIQWQLGYRVNKSETVMIEIEGVPEGPDYVQGGHPEGYVECKNVTNNNPNKDYFVPTRSPEEWDAFKAAAQGRLAADFTLDDCAVATEACVFDQITIPCLICADLAGQTCDPAGICVLGAYDCDGTACVEAGDVSSGQDPNNECSAFICSDYVAGWSGTLCTSYSSSSSGNGMCDGAGLCNSIENSCIVSGSAGECGSSECIKPNTCLAGGLVSDNDTLAELCYVSGESCSAGSCNNAGDCVSNCLAESATVPGCQPTLANGVIDSGKYCSASDTCYSGCDAGFDWVQGSGSCVASGPPAPVCMYEKDNQEVLRYFIIDYYAISSGSSFTIFAYGVLGSEYEVFYATSNEDFELECFEQDGFKYCRGDFKESVSNFVFSEIRSYEICKSPL